MVGFPGIIAHGMFTMAHLVKALTHWLGDPAALASIDVQFRAVVFMDEELQRGARSLPLDPETRIGHPVGLGGRGTRRVARAGSEEELGNRFGSPEPFPVVSPARTAGPAGP